jgi:lipopolysaccharide transport system ATP-binding protein
MQDLAIKATGLGKKYRLRHQPTERYTALRDILAVRVRGVWGRRSVGRASVEEFWALKDLSFDINRGDIVGIIGRNGAGKSTLLKILSRITEPSTGRVHIFGTIASLLEVGTGFHPELTGRENIFLNGAILGMTRAEMKRQFDAIVAFAEVDQFLDTPVKRYSSGMYVRLAFAVAAHVDPEILVIDEVLAVGDAQFQRKCLGKIRDVSKAGRTVLFVSHNLAAVQSLCRSAMLLERGRMVFTGTAQDAVAAYLRSAGGDADEQSGRSLSPSLSLASAGISPAVVRSGGSATFRIEIDAADDEVVSDLALLVHAPNGERVALIDLRSTDGPYRLRPGDRLVISAEVPDVPLVEMDYGLGIYVNATSVCDSFMNVRVLTVVPGELASGPTPREAQFRGLVELRPRVTGQVSASLSSTEPGARLVSTLDS